MEGKLHSIEQYFPKPPYQIQSQIAQTIFEALSTNSRKLLIIQSPTGTGKTYSLLCPILAWLTDNKISLASTQTPSKQSVPSWLKAPSEQKGLNLLKQKEKAMSQMIPLQNVAQMLRNKRKIFLQKKKSEQSKEVKEEEIEVDSEEEIERGNQYKKKVMNKEQIMIENQLKLEDKNVLPKLIFVSRTHSQLSQVIDSLKQILKDRKDLTYLELASKQQLCINKSINGNKANINEQCQNLLDHNQCQFYHNLSILDFLNKNIEQLISTATANDLCPYYSSRVLTPHIDILCLPYTSVLNSQIRKKLGININNAILVFDEGHNIAEYQKQMKSCELAAQDIQMMARQIDEYLNRYGGKLRVKNQRLMAHLLEILRNFSGNIQKYEIGQSKQKSKYVKIKYLDFLLGLALKQIKIHQIIKYFELNNVDKKISNFNNNEQQIQKIQGKGQHLKVNSKISTSTINKILYFLLDFVNFNQQNQILMIKWDESSRKSIKIMCLQSEQLEKLIQQSRMTIIAGGTMEPLDQLQTITQKWKDNMSIHKYPHIVKDNQCKIFIVKKAHNKDILFNHHTLNQSASQTVFKQICTGLVQKVMRRTEKGGGIVIFIQNYQLLAMFQLIFKGAPYENSILFDSREKKQKESEDLFTKYKKIIQSDHEHHHILISVMGGKLSQGINFSDRLARALIVFGLPYSNIYGPEIIQTMSYIDKKKTQNYTGKAYYQNLCLKTLNQTIGRGIRHLNDYVDIYLVDSRFEGIRTKLSIWMRPRISIVNDVDDL